MKAQFHSHLVYFQDHMKYKCINNKFGTIPQGSDLLVSLSWALGRMHDSVPPPTNPNQIGNEDDHDRQLQVVSEAAYRRLHSEIAKMGGNDLLLHHCFWGI